MINNQDLKSVIVLNGSLDPEILRLLKKSTLIIAADGAADSLIQANIQPRYVVGDGDSFSHKPGLTGEIVKVEDENSTDFEKAISFAKENSLTPSLVLGVNGGELDHILGNAMAMLKHSRDQEFYFLDSYTKHNSTSFKLGIPVTKQSFSLSLPLKSLISIITFEKAILSSRGLRWELDQHLLHANGLLAIRNENASERVEFIVHEGKALLIIDIPRQNVENYL